MANPFKSSEFDKQEKQQIEEAQTESTTKIGDPANDAFVNVNGSQEPSDELKKRILGTYFAISSIFKMFELFIANTFNTALEMIQLADKKKEGDDDEKNPPKPPNSSK